MFAISQDFAPPFKLILPFFILGSIFYVVSVLFLFFIASENIVMLDTKVLSFIHIFLLGFVMMIIFGAMAQLVPVVLEVGHFGVELFYAIWPLLFIGAIMMAMGFLAYPTLLPFGGIIVMIAIMIFIAEIFLTIRKVQKMTLVMSSVLIANIFLFIGIIFGLLMALGYAGLIDVDINSLLRSHVFSVIGGYVVITIMGLSVVLLPMFGLSHGFSMKPLKNTMTIMSASVLFVIASSLSGVSFFEYIGYALGMIALLIYFSLVKTIYNTRARKEIDIYAKSLIFAYFSMLSSLGFGILYLLSSYEPFLLSGAWLMFFGFFGFAITGHMYKIVPFLVWFDKFSPLVGKQRVPMLAEMLPKKSSEAQLVFCGIGVIIIAIAIVLKDDVFIKAGASFLLIGAISFARSVFYMINYK